MQRINDEIGGLHNGRDGGCQSLVLPMETDVGGLKYRSSFLTFKSDVGGRHWRSSFPKLAPTSTGLNVEILDRQSWPPTSANTGRHSVRYPSDGSPPCAHRSLLWCLHMLALYLSFQ